MEELTDFGQLQELLESILGKNSISFSDLVAQLQTGDFSGLKDHLLAMLSEGITKGDFFHLSDFAGILILVLLFALLRAMGQAFENKSITVFSGVLIHLLLIVQLASLFGTFQKQMKRYLENGMSFSSALFPVLAVTSAASGESISAVGIYASAVSITSLVNRLCLYILLPGVSVFLVVVLLDSVMPSSLFGGMTGFLKKSLGLLMKLSLGAVTGLSLIQMMILPKADSLRQQTLLKTASMIPGAGRIADTAASMLWTSTSLLKGSIGAVGMFCVVLISLFPLLRIVFVCFLYEALSAVILPIADKDICGCLSGFAFSLEYLIKIACLNATILLMLIAAAAW